MRSGHQAAVIAFVAAGAALAGACRQPERAADVAPSTTQGAAPAALGASAPESAPSTAPDQFTWAAEIARVEEVRGSAGTISVPSELRHYDDRRRFLAVQMADAEFEHYNLPHDHAELAEMIRRGELVGLRALGDDHILYDVGTDAREDPLAHFDLETGKDVPLFPSAEAYAAEDARLEAAGEKEKRALLAACYEDPTRAAAMYREYRAVDGLARDFDGARYDLADRDDRTRFQIRLLSFIRPAARDVLQDLARAYHGRFGRLLPVSSLVRTERYQQRLSRVNRNATRVEIPPHATGMAFDISYKFMAADEQNFLMEQISLMEDRGRVEALRENRNAFHVYTFADGRRPAEPLIAGFLSDVEDAHPGSGKPAPKVKPARARAPARATRPRPRPRPRARTTR